MKLLLCAAFAGAFLFAADDKTPETKPVSDLLVLKMENTDLKFRADLAAANAIQARLAEYRKQYEELRKEACREVGLKEDCVVTGKLASPAPPPSPAKK